MYLCACTNGPNLVGPCAHRAHGPDSPVCSDWGTKVRRTAAATSTLDFSEPILARPVPVSAGMHNPGVLQTSDGYSVSFSTLCCAHHAAAAVRLRTPIFQNRAVAILPSFCRLTARALPISALVSPRAILRRISASTSLISYALGCSSTCSRRRSTATRAIWPSNIRAPLRAAQTAEESVCSKDLRRTNAAAGAPSDACQHAFLALGITTMAGQHWGTRSLPFATTIAISQLEEEHFFLFAATSMSTIFASVARICPRWRLSPPKIPTRTFSPILYRTHFSMISDRSWSFAHLRRLRTLSHRVTIGSRRMPPAHALRELGATAGR